MTEKKFQLWWESDRGSKNKLHHNTSKSMVSRELSGARNGVRTRDLNLGKVALYQLSYSRFGRIVLVPRAGIEPARGHPHWILNPACLPVSPPRQWNKNSPIQFLSLASTDSPTE